jgi:hypothetical protein
MAKLPGRPYAELFPVTVVIGMMTAVEALTAGVNGLVRGVVLSQGMIPDGVVLYQGMILDGRNRPAPRRA